jgi:hypothetical protein
MELLQSINLVMLMFVLFLVVEEEGLGEHLLTMVEVEEQVEF